MEKDFYSKITLERVKNVSKRWNISEREAFELIVNFEIRQSDNQISFIENENFIFMENDTINLNILEQEELEEEEEEEENKKEKKCLVRRMCCY